MTKPLFALVALALLAACEQERVAAPVANPGTMVPPGSVQVIIAQERQLGGDTAVFLVRLAANGVPLASYQGTVTFAADQMQVLSAPTPENADGEFRIVNAENAANGSLRFAGFSTQSMASTDAFRIVARLRGPVASLKLEGSIEVAGLVAGTSIASASLLRNVGVYDASTNAQLVK